MKLEDIELQLGDKITFDDGKVDFIESYIMDRENILEDLYATDSLNRISKIERYVQHEGDYYIPNESMMNTIFYTLETIYEKKEILTDYEKKEILTDKERAYLSNIIEPFRDKRGSIFKWRCGTDKEYISIIFDDGGIDFPNFEKGKYYKNMELDKEYSSEELGL